MKLVSCVLVAAFLCPSVVHADPGQQPESQGGVDLSYLVDGGALPFFWGAMAGRLALDTWGRTRTEPLFFSKDEGGAPKAEWEVPGYAVSGLGVLTGASMLLSGDSSRMYHVKGLAESLMTGCLITGTVKVLVGRHRPDYDPAIDPQGSQRSFPSGHSTQAFAIASYAILFLRGNVFDSRRGDSVLPWYELATYSAIGLGAVAVAGERVYHNRHNLSDVMIGGLLGTTSSTLFYMYQQGRYERHSQKEALKSLTITPTVTPTSAQVGVSFLF